MNVGAFFAGPSVLNAAHESGLWVHSFSGTLGVHYGYFGEAFDAWLDSNRNREVGTFEFSDREGFGSYFSITLKGADDERI